MVFVVRVSSWIWVISSEQLIAAPDYVLQNSSGSPEKQFTVVMCQRKAVVSLSKTK